MTLHAQPIKWGYNPADAREAMFECDVCGKAAFVKFPFGITQLQRQRIVKAALDEHRAISCKGRSEEKHVYRMWVPRK